MSCGSRFRCRGCLRVNLTVTLRQVEGHKCFLQNGFVLSVNGSVLPGQMESCNGLAAWKCVVRSFGN